MSGENFDGNRFVSGAFAKGACAAVTRVPPTDGVGPLGPCIVVDDPLEALQAFAAYHRRRYAVPVVALTGSCGKTMAKDVTAALLASRYRVVKTQGNLNNAIGCPLSLLEIGDETEIAVIEMGANHAGEIAAMCDVARPTDSAITMVAPAHLEGFGTIERVAEAKAEIVEALPAEGTFYVNNDDPWCRRAAERHAGRTVSFGREGDVALKECRVDESGEMQLTIEPVGTLRLPLVCEAHATNVLLAVAVGIEHGITDVEAPLRAAVPGLSRFRLLQIGQIEIIDDTYNANPASMAAALDTLARRPVQGARIAALGEMLELGAAAGELHRQVGTQAGEAGVTHLYARGPHGGEMSEAARAAGVAHAAVIEDHDAIAEVIRTVAVPGSCLLVKGSRGMAMERVIEALQRRKP